MVNGTGGVVYGVWCSKSNASLMVQVVWCMVCGASCVVFCVLVHRGVIVRQYNVQEEDCMAR